MTKPTGIIILEGPDGAGKTTLGREIVRQSGGLYMHLTLKSKMWRYQTAALRWACRESMTKLVVVDRHWISELIYGKIYRNLSQFPIAARAMHRTWLRFGALYVMCCPPPKYVVETVQRLKGERKEMYEADNKMWKIAQLYEEMYHGKLTTPLLGDLTQQITGLGGATTMVNWELYDVTKHGSQMAYHATRCINISQLLRQLAYQPGLDFTNWNLSGSVHPEGVLLVGDKLSTERSGVKWPFYHNQRSSLYLMETLHKLAAREDRLAYVNANEPTGDPRHFQKINEAADGCKRVVALGNEAAATLKGMKLDFKQVRHPQHALRFTSKDNTYRQELLEAIYGT